MPVPPFNAAGLLPPGIHDCTIEEIRYRLGSFQQNDQRPRLFNLLAELFVEVRRSALFIAVVVDGSFVTSVVSPNDIDVLLGLPKSHDWQREPSMAEYNVLSRRRIRRRYQCDAFMVVDGDASFDGLVEFFSRVRDNPDVRKGLLRIKL